MTTTTHDTTLVLGGTGKTGRRVAHRLRQRGLAGPRSARAPARRRFDWDDRSTWAAAARRGDAPRTSPTTPTSPSPAPPRRSARSPRPPLERGVRRLVLLSGRGEPEAAARRAGRAGARRRRGPSCAAAGSPRTSARASCSSRSSSGDVALPAGDVRRALRRRRRHRRRRRRRADRGRPRRAHLRADRPAPADFAEAAAEIGRPPAASRARARHARRTTPPRCASRACPTDVIAARRVPVRRGPRRPQRVARPTACSAALGRDAARLRRLRPADRGDRRLGRVMGRRTMTRPLARCSTLAAGARLRARAAACSSPSRRS